MRLIDSFPPQIIRTLQIEEKYFVAWLLSLSYLTRKILFETDSYLRPLERLLIALTIISTCSKFLDGTFTIFMFPDKRPTINEYAKLTGTFDGAI
jgi:hypothetical protein